MSQRPWLTIAIPTYNRAKVLEEGLTHVISQMTEGVEVLICDNCSSDGTEMLAKEKARQFPFIRYIRNPCNIGADANVLRCLRDSRGKFVHLLADDDILLPEGIRAIRECVNKRPGLAFMHLNGYGFDGDRGLDSAQPPKFAIDEDLLFTSKDEFLEYLGINHTFLSAMIFRKEHFDRLENADAYVGTMLSHCHLALKCISAGGQYLIVARPCVAARGGNGGGYDLYKVFAQEWRRVLFVTGIECGFHGRVMVRIYNRTIKFFLRSWLVHMKINPTMYDSSNVGLLFRETWKYPAAWLYLYPFLLMPAWLVRWIKRGHDSMKTFSSRAQRIAL